MRIHFPTIALVLFLAGCQAQPSPSEGGEGDASSSNLSIRVLSDAEVSGGSVVPDQRRIIADILYEALQALDQDKLLTPVDDNAHARFKRVLALDAKNPMALQGLQDIVARYLELAQESMHRGLFDEAAIMIDRARFVDADHPDIANTEIALTQEMNSEDLFFELDNREFSARSEAAENQLQDIARQARQHSAFFLITAPNDDLARWMVSVMRQAVSGHRLRGNIELASRTSIRLRIPLHLD